MKRISAISRPNEQRKVEKLLTKLAKLKPISSLPAPIANGTRIRKTA